MPIKKASAKDLRQSKKRAIHNKKIKVDIKTLIKKNLRSAENQDETTTKEQLVKTIKTIDKAAQKNIIKKGNAARKKSRLMKKLNAMKNKKTDGK